MNAILLGYGVMGKFVHEVMPFKLVDILGEGYKMSFDEVTEIPDVIIDFSHPCMLDTLYDFVKKNKVPVVIATTGYTAEQIEKIKEMSSYAPVLYSGNYSLGVMVMKKLVKIASDILGENFDVELIEKHHNRKLDAPSGTAKMLVDAVNSDKNYKLTHGREGASKRVKEEIGVHAIRGGTLCGEHEMLFLGNDEVVSIKHEAHSRKIFAKGACKGAEWLIGKKPGLYNMDDVLFGDIK